MDESFSQYIGYIVFILIFILPRILKWFAKSRPASPQPDVPTLEDLLEGQTISFDEEETEEPPVSDDEIDGLLVAANSISQRTDEVERQVAARGAAVAKMMPVIESNLKAPLRRTLSSIHRMKQGASQRTEYDVLQVQSALTRHAEAVDLVTKIVDQRLHPSTSSLLNTLDMAAKDCLMPYMVHARRLDIAYPTHFAVTIAEEAGFDAANVLPSVAPLVVDQKMADLPRGWVHLVSDISLDVFHASQGLSRKLAMDLGTMPPPLSIHHYADTRTLLQGLVGAWLPRLFADVGASLQLGPAFVSGLMANVGAGLDEQNAVVAAIGRNEEPPPMHVRMFAALRTIARMGFADQSKTYWETWKRRLNYPKEIVIKDRDGNAVAIAAGAALDITSRVVDYLISEPLDPLGGYPLAAVPSLGCNAACIDRMQRAAASFVEGNPVNAPGRIIIGAALLAVEDSPTSERRIGGVALKSLLGKGMDTATSERRVSLEGVALKDVIHSRELALRAVAVGAALAPRNSRFRRG